ncbi:unnamed protein product [Orchesella dallaii]|uniref:JmjC domain-containing protein n=1 Tax=Orchesella dallaii TaxID=48710 RepID=A0ABP1PVV1_9HEXA
MESENINIDGATKCWIVQPSRNYAAASNIIRSHLGEKNKSNTLCDNFLNHKMHFIDPSLLADNDLDVFLIEQEEGMLVYTGENGLHEVWNNGYNHCVAFNAINETWIKNYHKRSPCIWNICKSESVAKNVEPILSAVDLFRFLRYFNSTDYEHYFAEPMDDDVIDDCDEDAVTLEYLIGGDVVPNSGSVIDCTLTCDISLSQQQKQQKEQQQQEKHDKEQDQHPQDQDQQDQDQQDQDQQDHDQQDQDQQDQDQQQLQPQPNSLQMASGDSISPSKDVVQERNRKRKRKTDYSKLYYFLTKDGKYKCKLCDDYETDSEKSGAIRKHTSRHKAMFECEFCLSLFKSESFRNTHEVICSKKV